MKLNTYFLSYLILLSCHLNESDKCIYVSTWISVSASHKKSNIELQ